MKIKMLKKERGSLDGITVKIFEENEIYDVNDSLADVFINTMKVAILAEDEEKIIIQKSAGGAPSNKMADVKESETKKSDAISYKTKGRIK